MKTRLLLAFCLVWALGCGNRDPSDVNTGFGDFRVAKVRVCNDSNCLGGTNDRGMCATDADCPDGTCEILVDLKECDGGVNNRNACQTDLECGLACKGGSNDGTGCLTDIDCGECVGGRDGTDMNPCTADIDCGGTCLGGTTPDGTPCSTTFTCGGAQCVGGTRDGFPCSNANFCTGGVCTSPPGVTCDPIGTCEVTGSCDAVVCEAIGLGCVTANPTVDFTGTWESCSNLDHFFEGRTLPANAGQEDGEAYEVVVSGCNTATLIINFQNNEAAETGCARVSFTSGDLPSQEACGQPLVMQLDLQ